MDNEINQEEFLNETLSGRNAASKQEDEVPDTEQESLADGSEHRWSELHRQYDVEILSRTKLHLDSLPNKLQSPEYQKIVEMVNSYISDNCKHRIIDDNIDVGYDESRTIYYCEVCLKTFDGFVEKRKRSRFFKIKPTNVKEGV